MTSPGTVEQYWTGVASQLQVEAAVFNRLVGHNGEMGRANELALIALLTQLLPANVDVGTGVIIDSHGGRSKQTDVIIYLRHSQPRILAQSTQLLFPVETVVAAFEVKTMVDTAAVADVAAKCRSVRDLCPSQGYATPVFGMFGFQVANSPSARANELNELDGPSSPDLACVLNPGLVGFGSSGNLGMSLVPLHDMDSSGARISRQWVRYEGSGSAVVRNGTTYPVARLTPYGPRYVFEPGRALLLFVEAILSRIASNAQTDGAWLTNYLPDVARETESPA